MIRSKVNHLFISFWHNLIMTVLGCYANKSSDVDYISCHFEVSVSLSLPEFLELGDLFEYGVEAVGLQSESW